MPSSLHEALIEMFRNRPSLAAELLGGAFGVDLPAYHVARVESGNLPDLTPTGWALSPLVLGPDRVPVVADADEAARDPELAVLSAMAHGGRPDRTDVLDALVSALAAVDQERATLYSNVVLAALPAAAHHYLGALVTAGTFPREYQSALVRRYVGQGRAEGEAAAVLTVLDARGIEVPADARARITSCTDLDQLDSWLRRAATANLIDELFDGTGA
jgi:hypothetical protein